MSYLGIDIGGTKTALLLKRPGAARPAYARFDWLPGADVGADLTALAAAVSRIVEPGGLSAVRAAGVALPATVRGGRVAAWPSRPSWTGLRLDALVERVLPGVLVAHEDDGSLAALAEAARTGVNDLAYLGLGIGGGLVLGGRLHSGPRGGAVEIGHMVVDPGGPVCVCGRTGCLQAVASGTATLARAAAALGGPVTPDSFRIGLAENRAWAREPLRRTAAALSVAVINLGELVQCAEVRIGGGFGHGVPGLVAAVREGTRRLARPGTTPPAVRRAAVGARASLHGALLPARGTDTAG
ncbi:ROK family protein [Streptomyces sp. H27-C3]|uniref:ROK family protein n=1 Tax=Streptomyces sp. H27-C3 TaxID=3046305 RepID=UPI0024BAE197|nr:ROK family protein [Streptomyces sp. H27-C3]MDJ0462523.1 ROK family protein [Streptomyces sp. H27-C3]